MVIQLMGEEKLKIIFNEKELLESNVSYSTLSCKDKNTKSFFLKAINKASEQTGFNPNGYKLLVEAFMQPEGGLKLIITRLYVKKDESLISFLDMDICFVFDTLEDVEKAAKLIEKHNIKVTKSCLYYFLNKYYLYFSIKIDYATESKKLGILLFNLSEYGERDLKITNLYLNEYGEIIISDNALKTLGSF